MLYGIGTITPNNESRVFLVLHEFEQINIMWPLKILHIRLTSCIMLPLLLQRNISQIREIEKNFFAIFESIMQYAVHERG